MRAPCPSPHCRRVFHSEVALRFHLRGEHPTEQHPAVVLKARRDELRERQVTAQKKAEKQVDAIYRAGCPCGKSLEWHREQRLILTGEEYALAVGAVPGKVVR